jgi:hypothetical protein
MLGKFRPPEECVGPSVVTVGAVCFVVLLSCMLTFSSEFVCRSLVERDISAVFWILECYYFHVVILYWECIEFWWERQKKRSHWEDLDVVGNVGG